MGKTIHLDLHVLYIFHRSVNTTTHPWLQKNKGNPQFYEKCKISTVLEWHIKAYDECYTLLAKWVLICTMSKGGVLYHILIKEYFYQQENYS